MNNFDKFITNFRFNAYPFSVFTAEEEKEFLGRAFIQPLAYSTSVKAAREGKNVFIYGERGTGKTALLYKLTSECPGTVIEISDYSSLPLPPSAADIYGFYVTQIATVLFKAVASDVSLRLKLTKSERLLLSYLLKNHTTSITRNEVITSIKDIQHPPVKRAAVWVWNKFLGVINGTAGAVIDAASDTISKSLGLPSLGKGTEPKDYFQKIDLSIDDSFDESKANMLLMRKVLALAKKLGINNIALILDRIDEDSRLNNDSDLIADFLRPFLFENEVFYQEGLQFIFSIWSIPFQKVRSDFRSNKFCVEQVVWIASELVTVLNKRLLEYSAHCVKSFNEIVADSDHFLANVVPLANSNPRDLWQLMNKILREQYRLDPNSKLISKDAMDQGVNEFVRTFSYYEYYPKKKNAKSNSMDVYSYIAHLLKLDQCRFTTSSLDEAARTGGSTSNYIVGMESIGLVRRCEEKGPKGANLYEIRDPKVRFAVMNKIEIRRDS